MKDTEDQVALRRERTHRLIGVLVLLTTVTGVAYAAVETAVLGAIDDGIFIGLLIGATVGLGIAIVFVQHRFRSELERALIHCPKNTEETPRAQIDVRRDGSWESLRRFSFGGATSLGELADLLYHIPLLCISALIYGVAISSSVFVIGVHTTDLLPRLTLALFLFCANTVAGIGIYNLLVLLLQSWHTGSYLPVSKADARTVEMRDYGRFLTTVTVISSIYIGICQSSVLYSHFPIGGWIYGYATFAFLLLLSVYLVPQLPLRKKLWTERRLHLFDIQRKRGVLAAKLAEPGVGRELEDLTKLENRVRKLRVGPSASGALIAACSAVGGAAAPHMKEIISLFL